MKNKIKNKLPLICCELIKYIHGIEDITDDEIFLIYGMLEPNEKERVETYKKSIGKNLNNKRLFCFICNLIDFKEIENNGLKKKNEKNKFKKNGKDI